MTQPAPTGLVQWIKYSSQQWMEVCLHDIFWIGFKDTCTHFPSKRFVFPNTLYDGKLGNNSRFAQCRGRVILHNYLWFFHCTFVPSKTRQDRLMAGWPIDPSSVPSFHCFLVLPFEYPHIHKSALPHFTTGHWNQRWLAGDQCGDTYPTNNTILLINKY